MRIAIYHPWIYLKSGLERTIMELKKRSRHEWTIYTHHFDRDNTYPELKEMGVVELGNISVKRSYFPVLKAGAAIAMTKLDSSDFDALMICCDGIGSFLTFRNHEKPVLCLCFTPLRAVYDSEYRKRHLLRHRKLLPLALLFEIGYKAADRLAWKHYRHVFSVSGVVEKRIIKGGLCQKDKIEIAHPGIDGSTIIYSDEREPYFFLPGRIMWTKNLELGINAFRLFRERHGADFRLIIAGMVDRKSAEYFEHLKELADGDNNIEFILSPTDEEMDLLYRRCYAVLFTAFNEDFGLIPIEGMSHGKPVVAVNKGGPTEVVIHEQTGLLADNNPASFSHVMGVLVSDPSLAERMGRKGLERSRMFTWDSFVKSIDQHLDGLEKKSVDKILR